MCENRVVQIKEILATRDYSKLVHSDILLFDGPNKVIITKKNADFELRLCCKKLKKNVNVHTIYSYLQIYIRSKNIEAINYIIKKFLEKINKTYEYNNLVEECVKLGIPISVLRPGAELAIKYITHNFDDYRYVIKLQMRKELSEQFINRYFAFKQTMVNTVQRMIPDLERNLLLLLGNNERLEYYSVVPNCADKEDMRKLFQSENTKIIDHKMYIDAGQVDRLLRFFSGCIIGIVGILVGILLILTDYLVLGMAGISLIIVGLVVGIVVSFDIYIVETFMKHTRVYRKTVGRNDPTWLFM